VARGWTDALSVSLAQETRPHRLASERPEPGRLLADASVVALLGWWATSLTWGTGGREPHVLSVACLLLVVATVLVRPATVLGDRFLVLVHAVPVAALGVCLLAPTGLAGLHEAASYSLAALAVPVLLVWADGPVRRSLLAGSVLAAGGAQFAQGWLPWWGGQDVTDLFQGTFYWHNQVGIFLAVAAVLGLGVVAHGGPLRLLGWVTVPLCVAGTLFTGSRGSQLALLIGAAVVLALAGRWRDLAPRARVVCVLLLGWSTAWVLTGPPFFPERVAPTAATEARAGSFVGNGVTRFEDWWAAVQIWAEWPLTGPGFYSFRAATEVVGVGDREGRTAFVHNGFLQAFSDGGLLLGLPVTVLVLALAWRVLRGARSLPTDGDPLRLGGAAALLALGLHSGMDFDWAYPALLAMTALVGVLALRPGEGRVAPRGTRGAWAWTALAVGLLLVGAVGAWDGGLSVNAAV